VYLILDISISVPVASWVFLELMSSQCGRWGRTEYFVAGLAV
jgi:hypothetical protein